MDVEAVVTAGVRLGEGPVWDTEEQCLYWVDIQGKAIHRYDPVTGSDVVEPVDGEVGVVVPVAGSTNTLLAAIDRRVVRLIDAFDDSAPTRQELVATLPTGDRANDGACDPAGRFLVGTLAHGTENACGLYRIDGPDAVTELVGQVSLSNGLDWSPDGRTFYFADTPTHAVDAFDYDPETATLSGRRRFVDLTGADSDVGGMGRPDGLTVDAEGGVWVTIARAGQVRRFDDRGRLDAVVTLPTQRVTS